MGEGEEDDRDGRDKRWKERYEWEIEERKREREGWERERTREKIERETGCELER